MEIKKRCIPLNFIFFEYLFSMGMALVVAFIIPYILFSMGTKMGWYTYANSAEIQAKSIAKEITESKDFNNSVIPTSCTYSYLSNDFSVKETNMETKQLNNSILTAKGEYVPVSQNDCYLLIKREEGYCVLQYYLHSRYKNHWMERNLPKPDKILIILCITNCLIACFIVTTLFAKRIKKQLIPLMNATEKIKEQDLDFELGVSNIKEFNNILLSFSDMKEELKNSLENQWRIEQTKKEQTSALAHDIKTPLTIIRGNAELLNDTDQTNVQKEYTHYILKNAQQMHQYLQMLIGLTQAECGYQIHLHNINTKQFIKDCKDQSQGLAYAKQLNITFSCIDIPETFTADSALLHRAIMNVISNASDYSPKQSEIKISVECFDECIRFCITDMGKGFSLSDLKRATNQFYMGDTSRNKKTHYGIGLYITESIVKLHKGTLLISNSTATCGGEVTIGIPV